MDLDEKMNNEIKENNDEIERLSKKVDSKNFWTKEIALCAAGSAAFVLAVGTFGVVDSAITLGSFGASAGAFCLATGVFCSRIDADNEIYYLKQKNKMLREIEANKVLIKH